MKDLAKVVDKVLIKGWQFLHFHFLLFILSSSSYNNKNLADSKSDSPNKLIIVNKSR